MPVRPQVSARSDRDAGIAQGGMRLRADRPGKSGTPAGEDRFRRRSVGLRADVVGFATAGRGDRDPRWATRHQGRRAGLSNWRRSLRRGPGRGRSRRTVGDIARCTCLPGRRTHILFTSGSTGTPKGVVISHRNVASFLKWAVPYFGIDESDRISGHAPLHFDLSTFDVYAALTTGSELHLVPPELSLMPRDLAALIDREQLTQWFSVPSVLSYMANFDAVPHGGFASLRRVIWCGDVLPTPVLIHWMERVAHAQYTNLYGPT